MEDVLSSPSWLPILWPLFHLESYIFCDSSHVTNCITILSGLPDLLNIFRCVSVLLWQNTILGNKREKNTEAWGILLESCACLVTFSIVIASTHHFGAAYSSCVCIWKILANTISCLRFTAVFMCASYSRLGCSDEKGILLISFCCFPTMQSSFLWRPVLVDYSIVSISLHSVVSQSSSFICSKNTLFLLLAKWGDNNLLYPTCWTLLIGWEMLQLHWPSGSAARNSPPPVIWYTYPYQYLQHQSGARVLPSDLRWITNAVSE